MGPLGWQETIFIFVLALLIFGPKKLPELGKTIGKAMTEFRRASAELKSTWDREMASLERENESLKEVARSYQSEIDNSMYGSSSSPSSHYDSSNSYYDSGYEYGYGADYTSTSADSSTVSAAESTSAELTADASAAVADSPAMPAATQAIDTAPAGSTPEAGAAGGTKPVQA